MVISLITNNDVLSIFTKLLFGLISYSGLCKLDQTFSCNI